MRTEEKGAEDWLETNGLDTYDIDLNAPIPQPWLVWHAVRYLLIQEKIRQDKAHEQAYYDDYKNCGQRCCGEY